MNWAIKYVVQSDYLKVLQIPLRRGRFLTEQDNEHAPLVAVVDEVFARKFLPGQDPVGKSIHLNTGDRTLQIVGVTGHVKQWGLDLDDTNSLRAQIYLSGMQMPDDYFGGGGGALLMVRYTGNLASVFDAIRHANRQMSTEQAVYGDHTMDSVITDSATSRRFAMILLASFAALALVLACVGIYGVMAYGVSQRTKEVGIRMALGARRRDVLLLVLREGLGLALVGVCTGIAGAVALTRLMSGLLFQVSPTDPGVLAAVSLLLTVFALLACVIPAYRSASINAVDALRTE
jgi:predicted permease